MMYYLSMLACLGCVVAALALVKSLNLSSGLTAVFAIPAVLLCVYAIAWLSAKDSAAEAAKNMAK